MPTFRVTGPDGRSYKVTAPEGATPEQIKARVQAQAKARPGYTPEYGATELASSKLTFGLSDRAMAGADALLSGRSYGEAQALIDRQKEAYRTRNAGTKAFDWATAPLNLMGGGPKATEYVASKVGGGLMRQAAGVGATFGAISGLGNARGSLPNQAGQVAQSALGGAILGPVVAKAAPYVIGGAEKLLRPVGSAIRRFRAPAEDAATEAAQNNLPDARPAVRKAIQRALAAQGMTPKQAGQMLDAARKRGVPLGLMDTGDEMRGLASALARRPGPNRTIMRDAIVQRQEAQIDRVQDAIKRDLGPTVGVTSEISRLNQAGKAAAAPYYAEAYRGGSMAPLEQQFQQAFAASGSEVAAARKALSDAQNAATQARAGVSRAGENVYANSIALPAARAADAKIEAAQRALADAETRHSSNLTRLQQAQADGSANAPGAVWSPRIQQFLDDPIAKAGLAKGFEVQRLEALAEGRPFNPMEYAVTGMDDAGNPIVGSVPNMRTLNAVKLGLDDIINSYPKDMSGKVQLDQRGGAIVGVKQALLRELDAINPAYAKAREVYAGPVSIKRALEQGRAALHKSADDLEYTVSRMGDNQKQAFKLGLRSALSDAAEAKGDYADKVKGLVGSPKKRKALAQAFGDEAEFERFMATLGDEAAAAATYARAIAGSPTAPNLADDANLDGVAGVGVNALDRAIQGQSWWRNGIDILRDAHRYGTGKSGEVVRSQLASGLSETDPVVLAARLKAMSALRAAQKRNLVKGAKRGREASRIGGNISSGIFGGDD